MLVWCGLRNGLGYVGGLANVSNLAALAFWSVQYLLCTLSLVGVINNQGFAQCSLLLPKHSSIVYYSLLGVVPLPLDAYQAVVGLPTPPLPI